MFREICSFDPLTKGKYDLLTPYLLKKLQLWPLFRDMWRLLNNFGTKGAKIVIFLIGGQNYNILKLRGRKVQFSLYFSAIYFSIIYFSAFYFAVFKNSKIPKIFGLVESIFMFFQSLVFIQFITNVVYFLFFIQFIASIQY